MGKPDFAGDLRERVARAIYAKRPDCERKPWPVNTAEEKRAYPHNPIAAVDLSYEYADAAIAAIAAIAQEEKERLPAWVCHQCGDIPDCLGFGWCRARS